jgi:hypothetical protein
VPNSLAATPSAGKKGFQVPDLWPVFVEFMQKISSFSIRSEEVFYLQA